MKKSAQRATVCVNQNTQPDCRPVSRSTDTWLPLIAGFAPFGVVGGTPGQALVVALPRFAPQDARNGAANRQGIAQDTMRHTGMKHIFILV